MTKLKSFISTEPAWLLTVVKAVIVLLVAFGVQLTAEQTAAIVVLVEVLTTPWLRSRVLPMQAIKWEQQTEPNDEFEVE